MDWWFVFSSGHKGKPALNLKQCLEQHKYVPSKWKSVLPHLIFLSVCGHVSTPKPKGHWPQGTMELPGAIQQVCGERTLGNCQGCQNTFSWNSNRALRTIANLDTATIKTIDGWGIVFFPLSLALKRVKAPSGRSAVGTSHLNPSETEAVSQPSIPAWLWPLKQPGGRQKQSRLQASSTSFQPSAVESHPQKEASSQKALPGMWSQSSLLSWDRR